MIKQKALARILCVLVLLSLLGSALAANSLIGEWKGNANVTGIPLGLSLTVKFNNDGTYTLSAFGLTAKGKYSSDGQTLSISITELSGFLAGMLQSPSAIGTVRIPFAFQADGSLSMSINTQGIKANTILKKR